MASEDTALALSHRLDSNRHQILFQTDPNSGFRYPGSGPDRPTAGTTNDKATRELTGFIDHQHRYCQPEGTSKFRQSMYDSAQIHHRGILNWHGGNGRGSDSPSGDGSDGDGDGDDDDDDDDDEDDGEEGIVNITDNKHDNCDSSRGSLVPSGNDLNDVKPSSSENHQQESSEYPNAVAIVDHDGELYYSHYLHGTDSLGSGLKDTVVESGCGFSGRKDVSHSVDSGDSLRTILSDPLTGALMDDAMILPCGHSFGSGGMQHVMKMKACYTCSRLVTEDSVAPNLALRSAVLAFRREEESQVHHASKRRRGIFDQDRMNYNGLMDSRGRGLHFPFSVADRVIIKGNKRTPERFVGCEAVVTTQCLNGWSVSISALYVVKTLDTAESIKVQYRSLAKVSDNSSTKMAPNWL